MCSTPVHARGERGLVSVAPAAAARENLVAMALLWVVPVAGLVLAMLLGGGR